MAYLGQEYVADQMPDGGSFEPLPAGTYTVQVTGTEVKQTKAGDGVYISLKMDVIGPSHQGRVLFSNLNIRNPNPKAEEIGNAQFKQVMLGAGLARVQDSDELIGAMLEVKVVIKDDPQYGPKNEVKSYSAAGGGAPRQAAPAPSAPPAASPAPAAVSNRPPFLRK